MNDIKNTLKEMITKADCSKPACANCVSYKNGGCSFGCLNERVRLTSANYSCDNFKKVYELNNRTIETLKELLKDVNKVDEELKDFKLFVDGKISENDLVELIG